MQMNESGKRVVVVTGGGQRLGRAIALAFGAADFDVAVIGRTAAKLDETVDMLSGRGIGVVADLTDPNQVRAAFATIVKSFGGVDALINNAASYTPFPFEEATDDQITGMIAQSLLAPIYCTRESLPLMRRRGMGDIVNISSQSVDTPQPFLVVYAAAKGGLEILARGLRNEYRGQPFRFITFQIGTVAGTHIDPNWTLKDRFNEALERSGLDRTFIAPGASAQSLAASILHAVTAPRDVCIQSVEARGT
jgi:NAD(P)-dependent dehydrogenase (short-subunit alcohol dehydrogenase family)